MESEELGETVIVVMDANRTKGTVDALNWALNHVVKPRDTLVVLGVFCELGKKNSCFPFHMGVGISAIWERLEFSVQGDMTPQVLQNEIDKKREEYQSTLQPFYKQCKKNKVNFEVKLAAGFDPKRITIGEAQNSNTRWIVLDSHLKRDKAFIQEHVSCNIAAMKGKNVAAITLSSRATECKALRPNLKNTGEKDSLLAAQPHIPPIDNLKVLPHEKKNAAASLPPLRTCWHPLSWKISFPRLFDYAEVETITNGFAKGNIIFEDENLQVYQGVLMETPVFVKCFNAIDERFWSEFIILSKIRHRHISNLVGFCCTQSFMFLLQDYSYNGSLDEHLQCDELAKKLSWQVRLEIAMNIGSCLRYLHEECLDGPIAHLSVRSSHVLFSHGCSVMLTDFTSARCLMKSTNACGGVPMEEESSACPTTEAAQYLSLDVYGYGLFLLELITGNQVLAVHNCGEALAIHNGRDGQSLLDWVLPLQEEGSLSSVLDPRLIGCSDYKEAHLMANAALLCLKSKFGNQLSITKVLAVLQKQ